MGLLGPFWNIRKHEFHFSIHPSIWKFFLKNGILGGWEQLEIKCWNLDQESTLGSLWAVYFLSILLPIERPKLEVEFSKELWFFKIPQFRGRSMGTRILKNYTACKLPRVDFCSKFQHSISNCSQDIVDERNVPDGWMDGQMKLNFSNISKRAQ